MRLCGPKNICTFTEVTTPDYAMDRSIRPFKQPKDNYEHSTNHTKKRQSLCVRACVFLI